MILDSIPEDGGDLPKFSDTYRHTLAEEAAALGGVAENASKQLTEGVLKVEQLDQSVSNLRKLHSDGLLEAYVLLARADAGIARDYPSYRQQFRDKLKQYLIDHVVLRR